MQEQSKVFELNAYYGLIKIQGKDGLKFLQGILTCDMNDLATKDHCFGAFCNLKGRVRALFRVFHHNDALYLITSKDLVPVIIPALKKHAMFSKIAITDDSSAWNLLGFVGERSQLSQLMTIILENQAPSNNPAYQQTIIKTLTLDEKMLRFIFAVPSEVVALQNTVLHDSRDFEIHGHQAWQKLDIRAGIPEVFLETTEKFLPHHLNLPALGGVSFTKGCYCGQEIIARMEYKGKIKYGLEHRRLVNSTTIPIPGEELEISDAANNAVDKMTVVSVCTTTEGLLEMLVLSGQTTQN